MSDLTTLVDLVIIDNDLSGELPSLKGLEKLEYLPVGRNGFSSIGSDFFDGLVSLRFACLGGNPFRAWSLPQGLRSSSKLRRLYVKSANLVSVIRDYFDDVMFRV
ncbi:hypothetical protein Droror1_Dr00022527 [Drosera rotundifolia]